MTFQVKPIHEPKYETCKKVFGLEGKRLIGHSQNEDFYEDTQGNTYSFDGFKIKKIKDSKYKIEKPKAYLSDDGTLDTVIEVTGNRGTKTFRFNPEGRRNVKRLKDEAIELYEEEE